MSDDAATHIGQLSPDRRWRWDGTAWTLTLPEAWQDVKGAVCTRPRSYAPSPAAFNWADADAAEARRESC